MFCPSEICEDGKLSCKKCFTTFNSLDCFKRHKSTSQCLTQIKCKKCNKMIRYFKKSEKEEKIANHDCTKNKINCLNCYKEHEKNEECILAPYETKYRENFPKLCIISGSVSDKDSFIDCLSCKQEEKCKFHEINHKESFVNFLYVVREIDTFGDFHGIFVSEKEIKNESLQFCRIYEPKISSKTKSTGKKTRFGQTVMKYDPKKISSFECNNAMDIFLKEIIQNETYNNSVGIIESSLMDYVLKSVSNFNLKIEIANNRTKLTLPFTSFSFVCIGKKKF